MPGTVKRAGGGAGAIAGAVRKRLIGLLHLVVPLLMLALVLGLRVGVPAIERYQLEVFAVFQRIGQWPWPRMGRSRSSPRVPHKLPL